MLSPAFLFLYASPFWGLSLSLVPKALDYMLGSARQQVFRLTSQARVALPWLLVVSSERDSGSHASCRARFPCGVSAEAKFTVPTTSFQVQSLPSPQISLNSLLHISVPGPWTYVSHFLGWLQLLKIFLEMLSIIAMCWSRGDFKTFTCKATEFSGWKYREKKRHRTGRWKMGSCVRVGRVKNMTKRWVHVSLVSWCAGSPVIKMERKVTQFRVGLNGHDFRGPPSLSLLFF